MENWMNVLCVKWVVGIMECCLISNVVWRSLFFFTFSKVYHQNTTFILVAKKIHKLKIVLSIFRRPTPCLYNCPTAIRHWIDQLHQNINWNVFPFWLELRKKIVAILESLAPQLPAQVRPKMLYRVEVRELSWPHQYWNPIFRKSASSARSLCSHNEAGSEKNFFFSNQPMNFLDFYGTYSKHVGLYGDFFSIKSIHVLKS